MVSRKGLFLILVLTLSFVPIFQATHALTHVADVSHVDVIGTAEGGNSQAESEADADVDRICLDCLALTAFSIILSIPAIFFFDRVMRQPPPHVKPGQILLEFSSPYLTRAPPRV